MRNYCFVLCCMSWQDWSLEDNISLSFSTLSLYLEDDISATITSNGLELCIPPPTCLFTRLERLGWSQQGFWQPSLCRKSNLWSLCCEGITRCGSLHSLHVEKTCLHFSCSPCNQCREIVPHFSHHNKGFINNVFCINWAVRNPAGTRLDSLAW